MLARAGAVIYEEENCCYKGESPRGQIRKFQ